MPQEQLKSVNNNLIIIRGITEGENELKVLIDPASQAEVVSQRVITQLEKNINPTNTKLVSAQGKPLEVLGQAEMCLNIAGSDYKFENLMHKSLIHYQTSMTSF